MLSTIRNNIEKYQMLQANGQAVVAGLSGGADSVAMLAALKKLGYSCIAAHCNFHLRGDESDRDERFAAEIAARLQVPFIKTDFDTKTYASEHRQSIEMAARELRYRWFEQIRIEESAQAISVAHHKDDNAETILINLVRGAGLRGLRGMKPKNGHIVRPLLYLNREEILSWLQEQGLNYITDSTNLSETCTRNSMRLRILPQLQEFNPAVRENIVRAAAHLSDVEQIYNFTINQARQNIMTDNSRIDIKKLLLLPAPETILYELLRPSNFSRLVTGNIFNAIKSGEAGRIFFSSTHKLVTTHASLHLSPLSENPAPASTIIREDLSRINIPQGCFSISRTQISEAFTLPKDRNIACLDYDKIHFPLLIRNMQPGDSFVPFGMNGRKKLSDFFTDLKYSRIDKENALLLCCDENIVWVVGERIDNRYRISPSTKTAFVIEFKTYSSKDFEV
jgi:tRNA(Ile)-lysidine synthase